MALENLKQQENKESSESSKLDKVDSKDLAKKLGGVNTPPDGEPSYEEKKLVVDRKGVVTETKLTKGKLPDEISAYTVPVLDPIRGMDWNQTNIPDQYKDQIVSKINTLGDFEKMRIIGCTDAYPIKTDAGIAKNKSEFETIRNEFVKKGGSVPTYEDLLKSPVDPQNTVLGYRRAMQGALSLNLNQNQMNKIIIGSKLGKIDSDPEAGKQERGFDVEADYSEKIENVVEGETTDFLYNFFGSLDVKSLSREAAPYGVDAHGYSYHISKNSLKTYSDGLNNHTDLYKRVMNHIPNAVKDDPATQEIIKKQITDYLQILIQTSGGYYQNGLPSREELTRKQYYTIESVRSGLLSKADLSALLEKKDVSVLGNKTLSGGETIKQFFDRHQASGHKIVSASNLGSGKEYQYQYGVENANSLKLGQRDKITKEDYVLIGLYMQFMRK